MFIFVLYFSYRILWYLFVAGKEYGNAIEMYSKAIAVLNVSNVVCYANRSLAYFRQENFSSALKDSEKAVKWDSSYVKGYYRRAVAQMSVGKFRRALSDWEFVIKRRPNDEDAALKYKECKELAEEQKLEKTEILDGLEETFAQVRSDLESIGMCIV